MELFVSNLSYQVQDNELRDLFAAYGEVRRATVVKDRETGNSRGFGFVEMPDAEAGQRAIAGLNGTMLQSRPMAVSEARPRGEGQSAGPAGPRGPRPEVGFAPRGPRPEGGFQPRGPRPEGGFAPRPPRPEGGFAPRPPRPEGGFAPRPPRPEGGFARPPHHGAPSAGGPPELDFIEAGAESPKEQRRANRSSFGKDKKKAKPFEEAAPKRNGSKLPEKGRQQNWGGNDDDDDELDPPVRIR